ncbi:MAG: glycoside hydrolase family 2 TIM barrel-domain containing protein [Solirubrobacteraceae bacterium]
MSHLTVFSLRQALAMLAVVLGPCAALPASAHAASDFDHGYLDGVSGPVPARTVDLAGTWEFKTVTSTTCPAGSTTPVGPQAGCVTQPDVKSRTIQVPGGGWYKQGFKTISEAIYTRRIHVPAVGGPQVTKLWLGAVNHQATVTIGGRVANGQVIGGHTVGTNITSFTPSVFDLSQNVKPGGTYTIQVDVKGRYAPTSAGSDCCFDPAGFYTVPGAADWSPNVAQGIFRSAKLEVFPALYISRAFVRTSVKRKSLRYAVSITNETGRVRRARLDGALSSWNRRHWRYPKLPARTVSVPARKTVSVTIGPVRWRLGRASYWWPDVPYRRRYRAQLHNLTLTLRSRSGSRLAVSRARYRFGFRETDQVGNHFTLNGVRVNFHGDNLQGADYDSVVYGGGRGDAYDTLPGFLARGRGNRGWRQAVENYLRLNYSGIRIHQEPATPYMLDVADERGLMILDETAIRGSNTREDFATGLPNMVSHLQDLVLRDRNHPSVLRWSQANEPDGFAPVPGSGPQFNLTLYRTIMAVDVTRPISTDAFSAPSEATQFESVAIPPPNADGVYTDELPFSNYTVFCHYYGQDSSGYTANPCKDAPGLTSGKPYGQGEFIWPHDNSKRGFTYFATTSEPMRVKGASDIRPYTLLSAWASVIPGVRNREMTLEQGGHPLYGTNNLRHPWRNPQIQRVQTACAPVAVFDQGYWNVEAFSDADGHWPAKRVALKARKPTTRRLEIFNDTFSGKRVEVKWQLRQGSPTGRRLAGHTISLDIPPGRHVAHRITFTPPRSSQPVYLVLRASKPGWGELFHDAREKFTIH